MKKNCKGFVEEIAAFASDAAGLGTEATAHAQNCARCREKIEELKAVAAMHREAAASMAEPKHRLGRAQLECALAKGGWRRRDSEIQWRPVLAWTMALAFIIGVAVAHRTYRERADEIPPSRHEPGEAKAGEETLGPTMLALRHEVEVGRDPIFAGTSGAGMRHYRVKDVASELRN